MTASPLASPRRRSRPHRRPDGPLRCGNQRVAEQQQAADAVRFDAACRCADVRLALCGLPPRRRRTGHAGSRWPATHTKTRPAGGSGQTTRRGGRRRGERTRRGNAASRTTPCPCRSLAARRPTGNPPASPRRSCPHDGPTGHARAPRAAAPRCPLRLRPVTAATQRPVRCGSMPRATMPAQSQPASTQRTRSTGREGETDRERERQTDRQTHREKRERERERERETDRQRERERDRDRDRTHPTSIHSFIRPCISPQTQSSETVS